MFDLFQTNEEEEEDEEEEDDNEEEEDSSHEEDEDEEVDSYHPAMRFDNNSDVSVDYAWTAQYYKLHCCFILCGQSSISWK